MINAFLQEVSICNYSNLKAIFVVIIENCLIKIVCKETVRWQILQRALSLSSTSGTSASFSCTPWPAKSTPQFTGFGTLGTTQITAASQTRGAAEGSQAVHGTVSSWTIQEA